MSEGNIEPLQSVIADISDIISKDGIDIDKLYTKAIETGDTSTFILFSFHCCLVLKVRNIKSPTARSRAVRPIGYFAVLQDAEQISVPAVQSWRLPWWGCGL